MMVLITRHMVIVFMLLASLVKVATADRLEESTRLVNTLIDDIRIITDDDLSAQDIRAHANRLIDTYLITKNCTIHHRAVLATDQ